MSSGAVRAGTAVAGAGAVAAAAGSAGPWVSFLGASVGGLEGDGLITLVLALVALGTLLRRLAPVIPAACGLAIAVVAGLDLQDIRDLPIASVGWGLALTFAGGTVLLVAAAGVALATRAARATADARAG